MLAACFVAMSVSSAHDPSEDGSIEPFVHGGALTGAWTTAGLVRWEGVAWLEVCGAALPGMTDAWLAADGRFLRAGPAGLEESTDAGCSFVPRPDVPLARGLTELGGYLAATTADPLAGVYVSADDGLTFAATTPFPRAFTVGSVAVDGAGAWWLAGNEEMALVSADGGASWEEVALPAVAGLVSFTVHGPGPGGGVLLGGATLNASTTVWERTATGWELLVTLPLTANHVVCLGPTCMATLSELAMVRWDATVGPASVALVHDGPVGCLSTADDGSVWGCNARGSFALFGRTTDGVTFRQELAGEVIAVRSCAAGTIGESECNAVLPPLDSGVPNDPDPPPPTPDPLAVSRGCATSGRFPSVALLAALLAVAKLPRTPRSLAR